MPNFFEKVCAWDTKFDSRLLTVLELSVAYRMVLSIKKSKSGAGKEYLFLGFAVILMLSDIKSLSLKREFASAKDRVDYLDIELTNVIDAIGIRTVETLRKLIELDQSIKLLVEELYGPDQDKGKDELGEENQDDYYNEDDYLENDDEQDDEG